MIELNNKYENKSKSSKNLEREIFKNGNVLDKPSLFLSSNLGKDQKNNNSKNIFENSVKDNSIGDYIFKSKIALSEEIHIRKKYRKEPLKLKKQLIFQFQKIKKLSETLLERIWMASEHELKNYSEIIENTEQINNLNKLKKKNLTSNEKTPNLDKKTLGFSNPSIISKLKESKLINSAANNFSGFNSIIMESSYKINEKAENNFNKIFSRISTIKKDDPFLTSNNIDPLLGESKKSAFDFDLLKSKFSANFPDLN